MVIGEDNLGYTTVAIMTSNPVQIGVWETGQNGNALLTVDANSQRSTGERQDKNKTPGKIDDGNPLVRPLSSVPWVENADTEAASKMATEFHPVD
jgi:hypothetical protein